MSRKFTHYFCKNLFKNSKIIINNDFLIIKKSNYFSEDPTLMTIVPKKVGIAVYRNYLKRCSREIFRNKNMKSLNRDFIFLFKKTNNKISFNDINKINLI